MISFYEAQVSLTSNFADPTVYKLTETSLAVEGVGTVVYVRVRGVRWDGDMGNWSNTVSMTPTTGGPVTYSRGIDDVEPFYITFPGFPFPEPVQRIRITPQRQNGGMVIFGSFATENVPPNGDPAVIVTLNGVTVSEVSSADYFTGNGDSAGDGCGCGLGPVFVPHDQFYFGDTESHVAESRTTTGSGSSSGVHTPWTGANPTVYTVTWGPGVSVRDARTSFTNFTNFNFAVPVGNTITGIQIDYIATDNNFDTGIYDNADLVELRMLDENGVARGNQVSNAEWGNAARTHGGTGNLLGEVAGFWTPAKINDSNFGVQLRGRLFAPAAPSTRIISMTWPTIIVYSANETSGEVDIQIRFNGLQFDGPGLLAATLNVIEFGDAI